MYWQEFLPLALECGMSPTDFWEGEPRLVNSYLRKHELELDEFNYKSWLSGLYVHRAVSSSLSQAFSDSKSASKTLKYFDKPIEKLNSDYVVLNEETKEKTIDSSHRQKVNFWAKFGKKGGK